MEEVGDGWLGQTSIKETGSYRGNMGTFVTEVTEVT